MADSTSFQLPARSAARAFQASISPCRSASRVTLAKYSSAVGDRREAACRPIAPQTQLRSSGVICTLHLLSSCWAAASGSEAFIFKSASVTSSLRVRLPAVAREARKRAGLSPICATSADSSGATISTAARAIRGRLASIARRALRQTSSAVNWRAANSSAAARVQPSSDSRMPYQLRRTSSTVAAGSGPVPRSRSTTTA